MAWFDHKRLGISQHEYFSSLGRSRVRKRDFMRYGLPSFVTLILFVMPAFSGMAEEKTSAPSENASLLYRKALNAYPTPEDGLRKQLDQYISCKGSASEEIRRHVDSNREVISMVLQAAQLQKCDWETGDSPSKAEKEKILVEMSIISDFRRITRLVLADARLQFERWNSGECFRRALACYRMAEHIGPLMYFNQLAIENQTHALIRWVLGQDRLQQGELKDLANQLALIKKNRQGFLTAFDRDTQETCSTLSKMPEKYFQQELSRLSETITCDPNQTIEITFTSPTVDDVVCAYTGYRLLLRATIEKPYLAAYKEAQQIKEDIRDLMFEESQIDQENSKVILDGAKMMSLYHNVAFLTMLTIDVSTQSTFNANEAAIKICLEKQRLGKLPDALPKGLPPDLFSGKDFEYKKTDTGFILRCQQEDLKNHKIRDFEFNKTDFLK
jgi:hypothetical protein